MFERIKHQLHMSLTRCENIKIICNERERVKRGEFRAKASNKVASISAN